MGLEVKVGPVYSRRTWRNHRTNQPNFYSRIIQVKFRNSNDDVILVSLNYVNFDDQALLP